jgi:hypothetical protein
MPLRPREGSECNAGQNEGDDTRVTSLIRELLPEDANGNVAEEELPIQLLAKP